QHILPAAKLQATDARIREAANIFYDKGANPRHIRQALSNTLLLRGDLTVDSIVFAAHDLCASTDFQSAIYADLWAIKCCSSRSFLPWSDDPTAYPFPSYLKEVVDQRTGEVNEHELNKQIEELRPYANV